MRGRKSTNSPYKKARTTELFLQSVLDSLKDRVNIVDRRYRIIYANSALVAGCAKTREEIIGKKCYETYWGNTEPCAVCVTPQTFQTGKPQQSAHWEPAPDGGQFYIEHYTFPIHQDGKVKYVIECLRDATLRKAQERKAREQTLELGRRLKQLRLAYRERQLIQERMIQAERMAAVGQMASSMAHELDTPLGTISGYCELLMETIRDAQDQSKLRVIADQTARCQSIIRNTLDCARRPTREVRPTDLNKLLADTIALMDYNLRAGRVKVRTDLADDLPPVALDPGRMQQVFLNLLRNACDAMPHGGEVRVASSNGSDGVRITFRDTGHGILRQNLKRIFEPFFTTKEPGKGTGLGLAICHSIVKDCGGRITARNVKGGGAEFEIQFPPLP